MTDLVLKCENCGNEFVFSEGEQQFYKAKKLEAPRLCPICRSIKHQEQAQFKRESKKLD
jgi:Zn finger protein HypA/HybF involved in hydrogenase expression